MLKPLAFSAVNGTAIFQRILDAIRKILLIERIIVWNYIDDIVDCAPSGVAEEAFNRTVKLICQLGLPINNEKLVALADEMTCMGILINEKEQTINYREQKCVRYWWNAK